MQFDRQDTNLVSNTQESGAYAIQANEQAFEVLSGSLYKYNIAAIVREVVSNAYDSHKDANQAKPFEITLPSALHPHFEVEDFGIGLDEETFMSLVTVYFASTKRDSDQGIGGFGLGFKTPLAFGSRSFTTRIRKDGIEAEFITYIGEMGTPVINKIYEKQTTEGNGVKISLPVADSYDQRTFVNEASYILSFFDGYEIKKCPSFSVKINQNDVKEMHEKGYVFTSVDSYYSNLYGDSSHYVVVGPVMYPININDFTSESERDLLKHLSGRGKVMYVKFDIGEIDILPSRESVRLSQRTKETIQNKIVGFAKEFISEVQKEITEMDNVLDVIHYLDADFNAQFFREILMWNGKSVGQWMRRKIKILNNIDHEVLTKKSRIVKLNEYCFADRGWSAVSVVSSRGKVNIIINDCEKRMTHVKQYRKRTGSHTILIKQKLTDHQKDRLVDYFGKDRVNFISATELIKEIKASQAKRAYTGRSLDGRVSQKTEVRVSLQITKESSDKRQVVVDLDDDSCHYVYTTSHREYVYFGANHPMVNWRMHEIIEVLGKKYPDKKLVLICFNQIPKKVSDHKNVQWIDDFLKEHLDYMSMLKQHYSLYNKSKEHLDRVTELVMERLKIDGYTMVHNPFEDLERSGVDFWGVFDEYNHHDQSILKAREKEAENIYKDFSKEFYSRYPMMKDVNIYGIDVDNCAEYIKMVDELYALREITGQEKCA